MALQNDYTTNNNTFVEKPVCFVFHFAEKKREFRKVTETVRNIQIKKRIYNLENREECFSKRSKKPNIGISRLINIKSLTKSRR